MKIAVLVPSKKKTGPVIVAADQIKILIAHGHECKLFYFDDSDNELDFACKTEKISLKKRIVLEQYDIVHCHGARPCLYVFWHKNNQKNTKYITTVHCYVFKDFFMRYGVVKGVINAIVFLLAVSRFDTIIALSKDAVKYYKRIFFCKKIVNVYNSIDISVGKLALHEQKELVTFKKGNILLGMHGELDNNKGQHLIISQLKKMPQCNLFLLGTGKDMIKLKAFAIANGIENRVLFAGFRKNAINYLPYYDIFLMLSRFEGCPLALLEAAAANKKIVCSNIPVHKEIFSDTEVVFFDIDNPESLVLAIEQAVKNPVEQPKLQKRVHDLFAPEAVYAKLLKIYNS